MRTRARQAKDLSRTLFESRTEVWRQVGLGGEVDRATAKKGRRSAAIALVLIGVVLFLFAQRQDLFPGYGTEIRIATVVALVVLGWTLARSLGRGLAPALLGRLEPGTAGTVGFLIRLTTIVAMFIVALRIAGLGFDTLAVGGAFTAVIVGLAAQQTLGNVFAGLVLLSTRPFRVGDRVRVVGGMLAGSLEGVVGNLGLFYVTLVSGADRIMIPNSTVLQIAVIPLREPERVELRARLPADTTPADLQEELRRDVTVPLRYPPQITLEELDGDRVIVRIAATPLDPSDGAQLAAEVIEASREELSDARDGAPREPV